MRVRPRSSLKNAWLLSAPSMVLLFSSELIPRKLNRPKPLELLTAVGVSSAKSDQRPPLMGKLLMAVWSRVGANSGEFVLTCGNSALTTTVAPAEATFRRAEMSVTLPTCTITFSALNGAKRSEEHTSELQSRVDLVCRL